MNTPDFYNALWTSSDTIKTDQKLWWMRKSAIEHSYALLGSIHGKKILEVGCGTGAQTVEFARQGALVTAIDVSTESVEQASKMARENGVSADVLVMNGEQLHFEDGLFDIIYIDAVLMHADPEKVLREASRVCREEGRVLVLEPLQYNPFSLPYRLFFSPYKKTKPHYMTLRKFKAFQKYFRTMQHKEFYFFSVLLFPFYSRGVPRMSGVVEAMDTATLRALPFLRHLSWITVVEYRK